MLFTIKMTLTNTLFWVILHFGVGYLILLLPKEWFNSDKQIYQPFLREEYLFKKIKIKKWKDKLPTLGEMFGFNNKNLRDNVDVDYLDKFLLSTCRGEVGHILIDLLGYCSILINPREYCLMLVIISTLILLGNIPFALIQRFNRARLRKLKVKCITLYYSYGRVN